MNPTLEEIKYDAKALFIIYVLLTCYCCYTATFDYYFAYKVIYYYLLVLTIPFTVGYLKKSFAALVFLSTIFVPLNLILLPICGDKFPGKLEPYQYTEYFVSKLTGLPFMEIIMYYLGDKTREYYKNNKKYIWNRFLLAFNSRIK